MYALIWFIFEPCYEYQEIQKIHSACHHNARNSKSTFVKYEKYEKSLPTFWFFPCKTLRLLLLLLLMPHWFHQITSVGFLKSLNSWYFFVNMIGQVSKNADAIFHRLNWEQWQNISINDVVQKVTHAENILTLRIKYNDSSYQNWVTLENNIQTSITCIYCWNLIFFYESK